MTEPVTNILSTVRGIVLSTLGFAVCVVAAVDFESTRDFIAGAQEADGIVVGLNAGPAHPQIAFRDEHGRSISFPGGGCVSHQPGERVKVLYLASEPAASAALAEPGSEWFSTVGLAFIGVGLLITGLHILRRRWTMSSGKGTRQ